MKKNEFVKDWVINKLEEIIKGLKNERHNLLEDDYINGQCVNSDYDNLLYDLHHISRNIQGYCNELHMELEKNNYVIEG